jgi:hypothetical protein
MYISFDRLYNNENYINFYINLIFKYIVKIFFFEFYDMNIKGSLFLFIILNLMKNGSFVDVFD